MQGKKISSHALFSNFVRNTKWFLLWCPVTPLWMKTIRVAGGPSGSCTSPCFSAAWVRMLNSHHGVYIYSLLCHTCVKLSNKPVHNVFSFRIYHCHHITVALSATGVYYFTDSVKITKIFGWFKCNSFLMQQFIYSSLVPQDFPFYLMFLSDWCQCRCQLLGMGCGCLQPGSDACLPSFWTVV